MAKQQTRRSISVRGTTYDALRAYCDEHKKSMSEIVEEQLERVLGTAPAPSVKAPEPARPRTVSARPQPRPMANKIVRAPAPPVAAPAKASGPASTGRPAPRPAREVIAERQPAKKGDYRTIQF